MTRGLGAIALAIVVVWLLAHLFYVGPVQDATEVGVLWVLGFATASLVGAAIILLVVAMALGQTRPAWLRFVRGARNVAAVVGCALILVGLLHYRDTEPRGEIPRIRAAPDLLPRAVDDGPRRVHRERVAGLARELVHRGQIAELHRGERYCASAFSGACGLAFPSPAR